MKVINLPLLLSSLALLSPAGYTGEVPSIEV